MAPAQGWHAKSWSVPHFGVLCASGQGSQMASGPDETHKRSTTGDVGCSYNFCLACITLTQENIATWIYYHQCHGKRFWFICKIWNVRGDLWRPSWTLSVRRVNRTGNLPFYPNRSEVQGCLSATHFQLGCVAASCNLASERLVMRLTKAVGPWGYDGHVDSVSSLRLASTWEHRRNPMHPGWLKRIEPGQAGNRAS